MARKPPPNQVGNQMGRMIAQLVARTVQQTRAATGPAENEARRRHIYGMLDEGEVELGKAAMEVLGGMRDIQHHVPGMKEWLDRMDNPEHAWDFFVALLGAMGSALVMVTGFGQAYARAPLQKVNAQYQDVPLSPADAADGVERNIIDPIRAASEAAKAGVGGEVFNWMTLLTGEPIGIIDALRLWRRGDLPEAELDRMIAYSRIRTEWTAETKLLAHDVLPAADVVEAYIKGEISEDEATLRWTQAGGMAKDFPLAALTAGNPIGVEAANGLFNHGLINDEQLTQVILHSRVNPQFEAMAKLLRFHYLSAFQIEQALTKGSITPAQATEWLLADGLPADQVAGLVAGAHSTKAAAAKNVSSSLVLDSYEAGIITQAQALVQLGNLGYHADEATIELESYDARRILSLVQQGTTAVRKSYMMGRIDAATAGTDLDGLGVDSVIRDHLLKLWAIERQIEAKDFTKAEIGGMFKKDIVSEDWAVKQWIAIGYTSAQATILLYEYGKPTPNGKPVA